MRDFLTTTKGLPHVICLFYKLYSIIFVLLILNLKKCITFLIDFKISLERFLLQFVSYWNIIVSWKWNILFALKPNDWYTSNKISQHIKIRDQLSNLGIINFLWYINLSSFFFPSFFLSFFTLLLILRRSCLMALMNPPPYPPHYAIFGWKKGGIWKRFLRVLKQEYEDSRH